MLISCRSSEIRGLTLSRMPVGMYWNENATRLEPEPPESFEVATGMSVPTRIVAWRLSSVITLGRDRISALFDCTSALMRAVIWLGDTFAWSRRKLKAAPPTASGVSVPQVHDWLPFV